MRQIPCRYCYRSLTLYARFQWANLQIKHIARLKLVDDIKKDLGKLPATLDDSYSQIWAEIHSESSRVREITTRALMWVMCGRGRFNQHLWAEASYYPESVPNGGVDTLFDFCRNLVISNEQLGCVIFAHLSVEEYLETKIFNSVDANIMAVKSCFLAVRRRSAIETRERIDKSRLSYERWNQRRTPFVMYSIVNWPLHVELCGVASMQEEILAILQAFLGTSTKPSEAYAGWLRLAEGSQRDEWGNRQVMGRHSRFTSRPSNPFFSICYYRFGAALNEILNSHDLDSNMINTAGETLLSVASKRGNELVMDILLGSGTGVCIRPRTYAGAVLAATRGGHAGALVKLLDWGKSQGAYGSGFQNILEMGARFGNAATVKAIMQWGGIVTHPVLAAMIKDRPRDTGFLPVRDDETQITEGVLVAAAANERNGREVIEVLLARATNIAITETVLVAAGNNRNATEIFEVLLARDATIEITEAILVAAAANNRNGTKFMEMLLARGTSIEITEAVLAAAVNIWGRTEMMGVLLAVHAPIEITEAVLVAAAKNRYPTEIFNLLLARDANVEITEAVLVAAVLSTRTEIVQVLLAGDATIEITEAILVAAVVNCEYDLEILEVLLARNATIKITERVLVAAANHSNAVKVFKVLLARGATIEITEAVIVAAANNHDAMQLFNVLLAGDATIKMTAEVRVVAKYSTKRVMEMLLTRDAIITIPAEVLVAAAANESNAMEVMEMLLARDPTIEITERVLVAAAANVWGCTAVMGVLLAHDANIEITEAVLVAAAENWGATIVMELLLARVATTNITEAVLLAAVHQIDTQVFEILLSRDPTIEITETVLVAAAAKESNAMEVMEVLLAREATIKITEAVLLAAANNLYGTRVMEVLLARDATIEITEAVLVAAAANKLSGTTLIELLLARVTIINITEAVLVAAMHHINTHELMMLLARDTTIEITEVVLVAAAANHEHGTKVMEVLLARDVNIEITEAVLAAAAGNSNHAIELTILLLARNPNLNINKEILQVAAENKIPERNGFCSADIIWLLLEMDTNIVALEEILVQNPDLSLIFMPTLLRARREFIAFNPPAAKSQLCLHVPNERPGVEQQPASQHRPRVVEVGSVISAPAEM